MRHKRSPTYRHRPLKIHGIKYDRSDAESRNDLHQIQNDRHPIENDHARDRDRDRIDNERDRIEVNSETLTPDPPSRFQDLPADILLRIGAPFNVPTLRSAGSVCRSWFRALRPLREAMHLFLSGKRFRHGIQGDEEDRGGRCAVRRDPKKALDSFLKAAELGLAMAMVDAGLMYWEMGKREEGLEMYRRAAELGQPAGMCNLAIAYMEGKTPDLEKAVELFYRSALLGYAKAQYNLALCLHHGRGVKGDIKEAAKWYTIAAEGGNVRAMYNASLCYSSSEELPRNPREARVWLERAANCGHSKAQLEFGIQHMKSGENVKALLYLELATRAGETDAAPLRDRVRRSLSDTSKERAMISVDNWRPRRLRFR